MPTRTESAVVAVFGNPSAAEAAAAELVTNAFAGDHIHIVSSTSATRSNDKGTRSRSAGHREQNVANWLKSVFGPDMETKRPQYEKIVHTGKILLGVSTPDQMVDKATEILTRHSPCSVHPDTPKHGAFEGEPYAIPKDATIGAEEFSAQR